MLKITTCSSNLLVLSRLLWFHEKIKERHLSSTMYNMIYGKVSEIIEEHHHQTNTDNEKQILDHEKQIKIYSLWENDIASAKRSLSDPARSCRIRCITLLSMVTYFVEMILTNKASIWLLRKAQIVEKNEFYEYPFYILRVQRWFTITERRWFRAQYPYRRFIVEEAG